MHYSKTTGISSHGPGENTSVARGSSNANQHGSRKGHSTTTCVGEILEDNYEAQEAGLMTAITANDMSAAFDLVDHQILAEKFRLENVGQEALTWIKGFLADRTQLVTVEGVNSKIRVTGNKGAKVQGGKSSCELFTIYLNDLPSQVNGAKKPKDLKGSTAKEYIDDVSTISRGKDLNELKKNIESDLKNLLHYLENHMMVVNSSKTQIMFVRNKESVDQLNVNFNGTIITHQNSIKILGVTLTQELKYDQHI